MTEVSDTIEIENHFRQRSGPTFFLTGREPRLFCSILEATCPGIRQRIVNRADQICDHVFDILGSAPVCLGKSINWHSDFKTGFQWDLAQFYADIKPAPYPGGYDIKVPWELSRCQHLVWLGQAYWFTADEKYVREFVDQVSDWMEQNPWPLGVNWSSTMDVAIRVVNWLWGYYYFSESPSLDTTFRTNFFESLLFHGRHIYRNLEWSPLLTTNHYLANIVGLNYLGLLFPQFKESNRWLEFSLQELEKEMFKQVYPDGVSFEASTSYHRLAAEMFLSTTILARYNGYEMSNSFMTHLEKMLDFILHITRPDGTVPLIGDNDNGRLHRLEVWDDPEREWVDYRYLMAIGALLFDRTDFARAAGDQWEEALWLFGDQAADFYQGILHTNALPVHLSSQVFRDGGLYILRDKDVHITVSAGLNGQNGFGGHAHNDRLSFTLQANGFNGCIDPGTYAYTGDYMTRNLFRSTDFHNTVRVDFLEQNRYSEKNIFRLSPDAQVTLHHWETSSNYDILDVSHNGYTRLDPPIVHRRQIFFQKGPSNYCIIRDLLNGSGQHMIDLNFHVGDVNIELLSPQITLMEAKHNRSHQLMMIQFSDIPLDVNRGTGWRSISYGSKSAGSALRYSKVILLPTVITTVLMISPTIEYLECNLEQIWQAVEPGVRKLQILS